MATFTPRNYDQILADALAYVKVHCDIDDFNVGSVARTVLEAAALEDDEQYFQMVQLLSLFSIFNCEGELLERRMADFGISKEPAKTATGKVRFFDDNLIQSRMALDAVAGSTSSFVYDASVFPTSGYPYTIRIGEGTIRSQDVQVTFSNITTNQLSHTSLLYDVVAGDRVALVTGAVSHIINQGQQIQSPATSSETAKVYATQEQAFIDAGNYYSNEVSAKATSAGPGGNLTAGRAMTFLGSAPFSNAGVVNTKAFTGGRNEESDDELVQRGIEQITGLSRGTVTAIKSAAKGVEDPTTGQRVLSSEVVEDFINNEVILYIDDGSGFVADYISLASSTTGTSLSIGGTNINLVDGSKFPTAGNVLIVDGSNSELVAYSSKPGINDLFLSTGLASNHTSGVLVYFVEMIEDSTEFTQRRFKIRSFPVVRNSETVYKKEPAGVWTPLTRDVDYRLNKGNGDLILVTALPTGSQLVVHHDYYINLSSTVQKVIYGDVNDEVNFPGVSAAGIMVSIEAPTIRRIDIRLSITAAPGFTEADLYDSVRASVEQYITSLKLGEDVIHSRIIDSVHDVVGVASVRCISPTVDLTILENQLPTPYAADGTSLVIIT